MNIKFACAATVAMTMLSGPLSADPETYQTTTKIQKDASGNYVEKNDTTKTDAAGNTTSFQKEAKVRVDADGNVDRSTTTQKVVDPAGFSDPHVVQTSNRENVGNGQVTTSQAVVVDGKVVDSKTETKQQP